MKRTLLYLGLLGVIMTVTITLAALWYVRSWLPTVGVALLLFIGTALALGFLIALARALLWLRGHYLDQQVIHRGEVVALRRRDGILHLSAIHQAAAVAPTVITSTPPVQPLYALPQASSQLPQAPAFATIAHLIVPGRLILGYGSQGAIYGDVSDLLSTGIVGKPGTGKSSALLFYLTMLTLVGASVTVFDPHGSLNELAACLTYSDDVQEMAEWVPTLHREIDERLSLWKRGKQVKEPLLVLIDELPVIARYEQRTKPATSTLELVERIVLESRKLNCYVMLSGQSLPAEVLPSLTRDNLSSRLVFNSTVASARMAGLDEESRKRLLPLLKRAAPGTAILDVSRRAEPDIVSLPYTTMHDLRDAVSAARMSQNAFNQLQSGFHGLSSLSGAPPSESIQHVVTGKLESGMKDAVNGVESLPDFSEYERAEIVRIAQAQCATYGRVVRSKIPGAMTPPRNNAFYPVVKYVLDEEGL